MSRQRPSVGRRSGVGPPSQDGVVGDIFAELYDCLTSAVAALERRHFLILEADVGLAFRPYSQVARELDDTWYCETVSAHYLPGAAWPIDEFFLVSTGWEPPTGPRDNWSITVASAADAALLLVDALRLGRTCIDPSVYSWSFGRFPPDDGGQRDDAPLVPQGGFGLAA